jgi:hypothetical protein
MSNFIRDLSSLWADDLRLDFTEENGGTRGDRRAEQFLSALSPVLESDYHASQRKVEISRHAHLSRYFIVFGASTLLWVADEAPDHQYSRVVKRLAKRLERLCKDGGPSSRDAGEVMSTIVQLKDMALRGAALPESAFVQGMQQQSGLRAFRLACKNHEAYGDEDMIRTAGSFLSVLALHHVHETLGKEATQNAALSLAEGLAEQIVGLGKSGVAPTSEARDAADPWETWGQDAAKLALAALFLLILMAVSSK